MSCYDLAVVCGRFQPFHRGHKEIVDRALSSAKTVGLYIGSCNNVGTLHNPLTFEDRYKLIYKIYQQEIDTGKLIVKPLYDREHPADDQSWGKYYLEHIHVDFGKPDLFVYGNDKVRNQWFAEEDLNGIDTLIVNRDTLPISGTQIRDLMLSDSANAKQQFQRYVPDEIANDFDWIQSKIKDIERRKTTDGRY